MGSGLRTQPLPKRASDPCRVRYGFWRLHALALAAAGPVHGGAIQRALRESGISIGPGTLMPALQQMVDGGLLERVTGQGGQEKPLRITPKGQQEVADHRPYLVRLTGLIDGKPLPDKRSAPTRAPAHTLHNGALAALLAVARESATATAKLRAAMQQMKSVVDAALSHGAS